MTQPMETNKTLITDPREIEMFVLSDKEVEIILLNSVSCKKTDSEMKLGKMPEQNEKLNK